MMFSPLPTNSQKIIFILLIVFLPALNSCKQSDAGQTEITFWAMGAEGEHIKEMLPRFEKQNPDIKVKVQTIPWSSAHEKLLTAFAGNATPDVCQLGNTWIPEFQAMDALYPLDSLIAKSTTVAKDSFFTGIWNTNVLSETAYGIPWYVDTRLMFYRKDILKKAGFENPPQTWEEWLAMARTIDEIQGKNQPRYAVFFSLILNDWQVPVILIMANEGKLLKDNYCYGAFDDPNTMKALRFYLTFFHENLSPRTMTEFTNIYQGFTNGNFAMTITGPWNVSEIRSRAPQLKDKWSTAPMPRKKNRNSVAGGASLIIFQSSKKPEAAWRLIEYLSESQTQLEFFRLTRDLPAVRSTWNNPELQNDEEINAFYQQLQSVQPTPPIAEWEQVAVKIQEHLEKVVYNQITLEEAVIQLNRDVNQILEKRRWLLSNDLLTSPKSY